MPDFPPAPTLALEGDYSSWAYWKALDIPNQLLPSSQYVRWRYNENDILVVTYQDKISNKFALWGVNIQTGATVYLTSTDDDPQPRGTYDSDSTGDIISIFGAGVSGFWVGASSILGKYQVFSDAGYAPYPGDGRRFIILKDGVRTQIYDLGLGVNCKNISISRDGKYIFYNVDITKIHILRGS